MRYRKFILAVLLALPVALQAQMTIPAERQTMGMSSTVADEWMYYMRTRLEGLMSDNLLQTTQVGIMVYDLTTHEVVFTRNERQRMRPASVMTTDTLRAPASREFSMSSFTTEAGRWTTSPAAIMLATLPGSILSSGITGESRT